MVCLEQLGNGLIQMIYSFVSQKNIHVFHLISVHHFFNSYLIFFFVLISFCIQSLRHNKNVGHEQ